MTEDAPRSFQCLMGEAEDNIELMEYQRCHGLTGQEYRWLT